MMRIGFSIAMHALLENYYVKRMLQEKNIEEKQIQNN